MVQDSMVNSFGDKVKKYKNFIAYCGLGAVGLAGFSYKMVILGLQNMKIKTKSKIPKMHANTKRYVIGSGIVGAFYIYGLIKVIQGIPAVDLPHLDQADNESIIRFSPQLQEVYIIKSMKMFQVSPNIIINAQKQFLQLTPEIQTAQKSGFTFLSDLLVALVQHRKVQKQIKNLSQKAAVDQVK